MFRDRVEDASHGLDAFGHHAALGCHMANESYYRGGPVYWDETTQTIKS